LQLVITGTEAGRRSTEGFCIFSFCLTTKGGPKTIIKTNNTAPTKHAIHAFGTSTAAGVGLIRLIKSAIFAESGFDLLSDLPGYWLVAPFPIGQNGLPNPNCTSECNLRKP
jgi:hypothetical protein